MNDMVSIRKMRLWELSAGSRFVGTGAAGACTEGLAVTLKSATGAGFEDFFRAGNVLSVAAQGTRFGLEIDMEIGLHDGLLGGAVRQKDQMIGHRAIE